MYISKIQIFDLTTFDTMVKTNLRYAYGQVKQKAVVRCHDGDHCMGLKHAEI